MKIVEFSNNNIYILKHQKSRLLPNKNLFSAIILSNKKKIENSIDLVELIFKQIYPIIYPIYIFIYSISSFWLYFCPKSYIQESKKNVFIVLKLGIAHLHLNSKYLKQFYRFLPFFLP